MSFEKRQAQLEFDEGEVFAYANAMFLEGSSFSEVRSELVNEGYDSYEVYELLINEFGWRQQLEEDLDEDSDPDDEDDDDDWY